MIRTVTGTYYGRGIRLDEPLPLPRNTRVRVTVRSEDEEPKPAVSSFLDAALAIKIEGPPDWSARIDHYLYGDMVGEGD